MARIRSIHPSLFTDEAWVSCSPFARVLYIGLMCEADDQGLFEWKPLQIKMRLLPGDNAEVAELLAELTEANLVAPLQSAGKKLGAIRRFCKFQRPKKPTAHFALPAEWRTYVGIAADDSEPDDDDGPIGGELSDDDAPPVPNQFPTSSELREQMEDGGGRREEVSSEPSGSVSASPDVRKADLDAMWSAAPSRGRERSSRKDLERAVRAAVRRGHAVEQIAAGVAAYYASDQATKDGGEFAKGVHRLVENDRWQEFAPAGALFGGQSADADPFRNPSPTRQRAWMDDWRRAPGQWRDHERGPKPGQPGCRVTPEIQREFGVEPAKPQSVGAAA